MLQHGIYTAEDTTPMPVVTLSSNSVQVVVGAASVHLASSPPPVGTPTLISTRSEAANIAGYARDMTFPINQSLFANFELYQVGPVVIINVIDPAKHTAAVAPAAYQLARGVATVDVPGALADSVSVALDGASAPLAAGKDYTASYDSNGNLLITAVSGGGIPLGASSLTIGFSKLDPAMVTEADILAGLKNVWQVLPVCGVIPGTIICPGFSQNPNVRDAMQQAGLKINGCFTADALVDLDTADLTVPDKIAAWRQLQIGQSNMFSFWPMVTSKGYKLYYSAVAGAHLAWLDAQNGDIPFQSPSNKALRIDGLVTADGSVSILDFPRVNDMLNAYGICSAINVQGWRWWGNYTSLYPESVDPKDIFIATKRMFQWQANRFIMTYLTKVDDPTNTRMIEFIVDNENAYLGALKGQGILADASIQFVQEDNPLTQLLAGTISFRQSYTPFLPAQAINNTLQFDPSALQAALLGGVNNANS